MEGQVQLQDVERFSAAFDADPKNLLALNAVTKNDVNEIALSRQAVSRIDHTYSHLIQTPDATNQKSSGRCWLFAGLNTLRLKAMEKMKLEKFELSQAYPMFWDKLEKANFFLESIIETRDEPLNGRLVMWLLSNAVPDGGQWDMFINVVAKYGAVPKTVMDETHSSSSTGSMNRMLIAKLREHAKELREAHGGGAPVEQLRVAKRDMMEEIYRMLCIHLGKPPTRFFWEWRDKDKEFHREGEITPLEFYQKYVGVDLDTMACLINAPTADKPCKRLYTVQYLGNIVGGQIVRYLNVDMATLKKAAVNMIADDKPVWFGCDVGKGLQREMGLLDAGLHDYAVVYGTEFKLDKAARLDYGHSRMTHAMVLTGVDLDDGGDPIKWRVENSWGTDRGDKGYMLMTDRWFDEYLYEITVSKEYLSEDLLEVLDTEPVVLPPWDPMGALAMAK